MTIKTKRNLTITVVLGAAVLLFTGCPPETVSIQERVRQFMSDVQSGNYGNLHTHLHPNVAQRGQLTSGEAWNPKFPTAQTYTYTNLTVSGNTATISLTSSGSAYNSSTITFTMLEDGSDIWKIRRIEDLLGGTVQ